MSSGDRHGWTDRFSGLADLDAPTRQMLEASGRILRLSKGARIFGPGQSPQSFVLLLEGDIRVSQTSENGREIVLYRVLPGESCALTTACLLGNETYSAEAVAETDVEAVALPRTAFDELTGRSAAFRRFVFASFGHRITELFKLVDEIAFQRMDMRLAHKLLELAGDADELSITHQQLAAELGTAREVVSRQINEFTRRGLIAAGRGNLRLANRAALQRLAHEDR